MNRRTVAVIALSLLSIALWAPDVKRAFGYPLGMETIAPAGDGVHFRAVSPEQRLGPGSPFADLAASPPVMRLRWLRNGSCWMASPGERCDFAVRTAQGTQYFSAPASPESRANGPIVLIRVTLALLWLISAAAFLLLRPSPATWSFFVLSLYGWTPNNVVTEVGPVWLQTAMTLFENLWEACIPFAAPLFALYLLQDASPPARWRRGFLAVAYAGVAAMGAAVLAISLWAIGGGPPLVLRLSGISTTVVAELPALATIAFLFVTYRQSGNVERQRIRWVIVGFVLGYAALIFAIHNTGDYRPYSAGQALYVFFVTASTGYAVLRHRIIDVNVVVSRTLVYTLLSALVVGLFAIVDLFFSRALSESKAGLMADVGLALVLGFFLNSMHGRVDRFVDGILFRQKHLAEAHVGLAAESLRQAKHESVVDRMLLEEPVRAFDLLYGVLARVDGQRLEITLSTENAIPAGTTIANAERLASYVATRRKALSLRQHYWHDDALHAQSAEPTIAVPVFSHEELAAVAFFAAHVNGTELDGDETALIERMAEAAGAAYDRLEAKELRERALSTVRKPQLSGS